MRGYPQFSFWISITLGKIYLSCIIINRGKNTIELVGTVRSPSGAYNSTVFGVFTSKVIFRLNFPLIRLPQEPNDQLQEIKLTS